MHIKNVWVGQEKLESETKRSFTILRENLCQRLVDALTHKINKVKVKTYNLSLLKNIIIRKPQEKSRGLSIL